jgi:hypothetical protein
VKYTKLALVLLLCSVAAKAQTPLPPPPVQHFVISVNAAGYNGNSGMTPLTIMGTALQLTPSVSVGYNQIFDPTSGTNPNFKLGVVNYSRELGDICPFCKNHFVFDTTNILITLQGGAGKVSYTLPGASTSTSHIAGTFGGFLSIPLQDHVSFQLIGYQGLFGAGTTRLTRNVTGQISSGLYFTF